MGRVTYPSLGQCPRLVPGNGVQCWLAKLVFGYPPRLESSVTKDNWMACSGQHEYSNDRLLQQLIHQHPDLESCQQSRCIYIYNIYIYIHVKSNTYGSHKTVPEKYQIGPVPNRQPHLTWSQDREGNWHPARRQGW